MELAGFELTFERAFLLLLAVFLVINAVRIQATVQLTQQAVQQTQQAVQQTRVELKQFKEDVPHREFSSPFPTLPGFHPPFTRSLPPPSQNHNSFHPQPPT